MEDYTFLHYNDFARKWKPPRVAPISKRRSQLFYVTHHVALQTIAHNCPSSDYNKLQSPLRGWQPGSFSLHMQG